MQEERQPGPVVVVVFFSWMTMETIAKAKACTTYADVAMSNSSSPPASPGTTQDSRAEQEANTKEPVQAKRFRISPSSSSSGGGNNANQRYIGNDPKRHKLLAVKHDDENENVSTTLVLGDPTIGLLDPTIHGHRIAAREKAIDKGKNTAGYDNYIQQVPKETRRLRSMETPTTPNPRWDVPAKRWQGLVRAWRRALHQYDPPDLIMARGGNSSSNGAGAQQEPSMTTNTGSMDDDDDAASANNNSDMMQISPKKPTATTASPNASMLDTTTTSWSENGSVGGPVGRTLDFGGEEDDSDDDLL